MAKNLEIAVLLDLYGDMLTEKQRDFLGYYYNDDLSLSEIAQSTRPRARNPAPCSDKFFSVLDCADMTAEKSAGAAL